MINFPVERWTPPLKPKRPTLADIKADPAIFKPKCFVGGRMSQFRTKSLTVRATKVSISLDSNQREAARITAALRLDPGRLYAGALLGWLEFTNSVREDGQAHHGQWIVLWPDGQLSAMTDEQFNLLFVPAAEN